MRYWKHSLVGTGFIVLLLFFSNAAEARVSFSFGIGVPLVHHYPGYYDCYPYYPWHGGYYSWWDAGWHRHYPRRHHGYRRSCSSSLGIWIGGVHPVVIDPPVVVHRVKAGRSEAVGSAKDMMSAQQREALRRKKNEWLKALKIADKEQRIQVVHELASFSSDDKVRRALEEILLSNPDPQLRQEVAIAFGKAGNRHVLVALKDAKENDPDRDVRQAAYRSIIMIEGY